MNDINIDYFITIVNEGNLTKASQKLFVSQPSLSQYIHRLEKKLHTTLFDRTTSPLKLTYAGKQYYEYILQVRDLRNSIEKELLEINQGTAGVIRLGITLWRGACVLPQILPVFTRKYPHIKIDLFEGRGLKVADALRNDDIDFAIMNVVQNDIYDEFIYDTITMERILLAVPSNHPVVRKILKKNEIDHGYLYGPISILNQMPLILSKPEQHITKAVNYALTQYNIRPHILLTTENQTTSINLVSTGIGCAFIPEMGAKICQRPNKVTYLTLNLPALIWPLAAVYKKNSYLPKCCQLFINMAKKVLALEIHDGTSQGRTSNNNHNLLTL